MKSKREIIITGSKGPISLNLFTSIIAGLCFIFTPSTILPIGLLLSFTVVLSSIVSYPTYEDSKIGIASRILLAVGGIITFVPALHLIGGVVILLSCLLPPIKIK